MAIPIESGFSISCFILKESEHFFTGGIHCGILALESGFQYHSLDVLVFTSVLIYCIQSGTNFVGDHKVYGH